MVIRLDSQNITLALTIIGALVAFIAFFLKWYDWYKDQTAQGKEMEEIRKTHSADIHSVREEQALIIYGVLACLKGLQEQGCNGPVTKAIEKIEKHLNEEAHK